MTLTFYRSFFFAGAQITSAPRPRRPRSRGGASAQVSVVKLRLVVLENHQEGSRRASKHSTTF